MWGSTAEGREGGRRHGSEETPPPPSAVPLPICDGEDHITLPPLESAQTQTMANAQKLPDLFGDPALAPVPAHPVAAAKAEPHAAISTSGYSAKDIEVLEGLSPFAAALACT